MNLIITEANLKSPNLTVIKPSPDFLIEVGEERFRKLVNDHYELIRSSDISFMFPIEYEDEFEKVKKHAADFLIQICGGPNYYAQTRGDSRMLSRHARFRIEEKGRKTWLGCYATLLKELEKENISTKSIQSFWNYLDSFSMVLINT